MNWGWIENELQDQFTVSVNHVHALAILVSTDKLPPVERKKIVDFAPYQPRMLEMGGELCFNIPHLRPTEYKRSRLPRNRRSVNRPYGGVLSGIAVRERIVRDFLIEEQKIVKKVLKIQKAKEKAATKS